MKIRITLAEFVARISEAGENFSTDQLEAGGCEYLIRDNGSAVWLFPDSSMGAYMVGDNMDITFKVIK